VDLYLHSPIHLHAVLLNYLNPGSTLPLSVNRKSVAKHDVCMADCFTAFRYCFPQIALQVHIREGTYMNTVRSSSNRIQTFCTQCFLMNRLRLKKEIVTSSSLSFLVYFTAAEPLLLPALARVPPLPKPNRFIFLR
jgi:hypothetical protein